MATDITQSRPQRPLKTCFDEKCKLIGRNDDGRSEIPLETSATTELSNTAQCISAQDFHKFGISIADWARARHFNVRLVYSVVRGERKCLRGESYQIAKELGMK